MQSSNGYKSNEKKFPVRHWLNVWDWSFWDFCMKDSEIHSLEIHIIPFWLNVHCIFSWNTASVTRNITTEKEKVVSTSSSSRTPLLSAEKWSAVNVQPDAWMEAIATAQETKKARILQDMEWADWINKLELFFFFRLFLNFLVQLCPTSFLLLLTINLNPWCCASFDQKSSSTPSPEWNCNWTISFIYQ